MKMLVLENNWLTRGFFDFGWGNGYVLIPQDHILHGKHYDDIDVEVHGGLTFSKLVDSDMVEKFGLDKSDIGKWCIGFDTCHGGDTLAYWTKERVTKETENLLRQLIRVEALY